MLHAIASNRSAASAVRAALPALTAILFGLGVWVGLLLFIIPGIMLMLRWSVAVPACVLEGTGPVASLGRSAALTQR